MLALNALADLFERQPAIETPLAQERGTTLMRA